MSEIMNLEEASRKIDELTKERDAFSKALSNSNSSFMEKVKEFSIIKRIGDSMRWNLDRRRICTGIVNVIIDETSTENCSLWLVDESRSFLELKATRGQEDKSSHYFSEDEPATTKLALGEGVAGWVALHGKSMLVKDTSKTDRFLNIESHLSSSIKSLLCLPIMGEDEAMGVINMSHPDIGAFSKENERVLSLISSQAVLAFANLLLFEKIQGFNERLETVVAERTRDLRYSESKYRSFIEHAGDAIVIIEASNGNIIEVNTRACEYTSFMKEQLVGSNLSVIIDRDLQKSIEGIKVSKTFNRHLLVKNGGGALYVDITANIISTSAGNMIQLIIRDISERMKLEEQLKNYSERLEELVEQRTEELKKVQGKLLIATKMAAVGELASGVAHEINNPMAVISGYAEDLVDRVNVSFSKMEKRELIDGLAMITKQADRCQKITRSLLDFTRIEDMNIGPVNINLVLDQAAHFAGHRKESASIYIKTELDGGVPLIESDSNMIEQIALNILNNAIDAVEKSGLIYIITGFDQEFVTFTIKDDGQGIASNLHEKIFSPFFTTKPVGKGTGLGLSICHQLIERLKGAISLHSELGNGAEFTVTLPRNSNRG